MIYPLVCPSSPPSIPSQPKSFVPKHTPFAALTTFHPHSPHPTLPQSSIATTTPPQSILNAPQSHPTTPSVISTHQPLLTTKTPASSAQSSCQSCPSTQYSHLLHSPPPLWIIYPSPLVNNHSPHVIHQLPTQSQSSYEPMHQLERGNLHSCECWLLPRRVLRRIDLVWRLGRLVVRRSGLGLCRSPLGGVLLVLGSIVVLLLFVGCVAELCIV
mmetsp:Transcript_10056/g.14935  ORF Transcript_10056/g.14935 Transcript_10056/m.14935 type:complete len:214 (-) Transcript_10056:268-909(-)